jgi:hypothetical protein
MNAMVPQNFQLVFSNGCSIPVLEESVNVAYSYQLMEHLHPDDAFEQLQNIYKVLTTGGVYICDTPNRLSGPHDISRHFDTVAQGFHLKEYTITELSDLLKKVGFSKIRVYIRIKKIYIFLYTFPAILCEKLLSILPYSLRQGMVSNLPISWLLGIRLVGTK